MPVGLKYTLARLGLFAACAVVTMVVLPAWLNPFLKLLVALVVSAVLAFVLLRRWRDEVAERMSENQRRRVAQKKRLRSALAGDDDPPS